ncbi:hypothetical protein BKA83DRAFT_4044697 [Pisolithus microcarpus]|nr:hypothetical protein BKA83DRAFT_4044697 [Pisolithus microcarpus]
MALFWDHPFRNVFKGFLALAMAHIIMKFLPQSMHVVHLTQTSVTILVIVALIFFVVRHHSAEGRFLTRGQEEMIVIAGLGAFWLAVLLAMRAYNQSSIDVDLAHPRHLFSPSTGNAETNVVGAGGRRAPAGYSARERYGDRPKTGYRKEYPCNPNDVYCVVEEWAFY